MKHFRGVKAGGKHLTLVQAAVPVVEMLQRQPEVTSISPGRIDRHTVHGNRTLKVWRVNGGLRVRVKGTGGIQELYVYTRDPVATEQALREFDSS